MKGGLIDFPKVSVGATESAIMTSVLAKGKTTIQNAAQEPEIVDLAKCLISAGADISGIGTSTIIINGVEKLYSVDHEIVPDRIEAGSFAIASSMTKGNIEITHIRPEDLEFFLKVLKHLLLAGLLLRLLFPVCYSLIEQLNFLLTANKTLYQE